MGRNTHVCGLGGQDTWTGEEQVTWLRIVPTQCLWSDRRGRRGNATPWSRTLPFLSPIEGASWPRGSLLISTLRVLHPSVLSPPLGVPGALPTPGFGNVVRVSTAALPCQQGWLLLSPAPQKVREGLLCGSAVPVGGPCSQHRAWLRLRLMRDSDIGHSRRSSDGVVTILRKCKFSLRRYREF